MPVRACCSKKLRLSLPTDSIPALLLLLLVSTSSGLAAPGPALVDVFVAGQDGYRIFRIPSLLQTSHLALLAFAEGRASLGDHAQNDLVLKRSSDHGRSWSPLQVIAEDGSNALNNPTAVLLRDTGRVLLVYQRYPQGFDEHRAEPGLDGPRVCRTFLLSSDDDGVTWSRPREITASVKRPTEVTSTAAGPGIGLQLRRGKYAGRVLIPFNQGPYGHWKVYAAMSDDAGERWRYGNTAPASEARSKEPGDANAAAPDEASGHANEVQFVELQDGTVLLNARNQGGAHRRKIALSRDGGETWSVLRDDPLLLDPPCQASLLRHPDRGEPGADVLLFCHPASAFARTNGTLRLSRDEGRSWPVSRVLYPGSFAYSCLASLPDQSVGCLFERDGMSRITFAQVNVEWIEGHGSLD